MFSYSIQKKYIIFLLAVVGVMGVQSNVYAGFWATISQTQAQLKNHTITFSQTILTKNSLSDENSITGNMSGTLSDGNKHGGRQDGESENIKTNDYIQFSVEHLIQKDFDGSNLVFEEQLQQNGSYTRYRISYQSDGLLVSGIMNIPNGQGPFPVIILNHGYIDPAVYTVGRGLKREQDFLARAGFVVLHTDYRNHGLSDKDPLLEENYTVSRSFFYASDAINAIYAIKELDDARFATDKVAMLGHSMGGGVTMHAMIAKPDLIKAGILYAPVHINEKFNFDRWRANSLSQNQKKQLEDTIGDINNEESFFPYSAHQYSYRISSPIQTYHGTNDKSCPYGRALDIESHFGKVGVDHQLITLDGEQHEFIAQRGSFMNGVTDFLLKTFNS